MPGPSERARFYASREWGILKQAVRERSGGTCENCHRAKGTEVHHEIYDEQRWGGRELLTDLLHLCRPCHEFKSGITTYDPANPPPTRSLVEARREAQAKLRALAATGNADAIDRLKILQGRGLLVGR